MTGHTCNAYCTEPEHCEIIYAPATLPPATVAGALWQHRSLWATRIQPAREAPPITAIPTDHRDNLGSRPAPSDSCAWLVWWLPAETYLARRRALRSEGRSWADVDSHFTLKGDPDAA